MKRVVITGCGTINPLGRNVEETWKSLAEGKDGISKLDIPSIERLSIKNGGQVKIKSILENLPKNFNTNADRVTLLSLIASIEAVNSSGINFEQSLNESSAVILGTAGGGLTTQDENFRKVYEQKKNRVHPLTVPRLMHSASASTISIENNITGPTFTVSTACASSNHAIGQAFALIRSGQIVTAVTGGADSMLCFGGLKAWEGLRVMTTDKCRPFCATRDGMIQSEGATVFILEELDHALSRNADIYAELIGYSMNSDAFDIMNPSPKGLKRAMELALTDAKLDPECIGYINAHGTGTYVNDKIESLAINKIFKGERLKPFVSSTKSMHGHLIGGSGAIELLSCILALKKGILAPTINFEKEDPLCAINLVKNNSVEAKVTNVMSNSFAFGGLNAVLVLRSF
ncbi:MAG: beta-ketoacyl-[acyl-carrier-protein] synthase family protein [Paracoccaceae bacterium]